MKYLTFCLDFFGRATKRLGQKDKVNSKIYDVTAWLTNNCNTHIAQYLEKQWQSDNDVWSVNRLKHENYFY